MAKAYKCDRCGKFCDWNKQQPLYITDEGIRFNLIQDNFSARSFDFCEECIAEFKIWMNKDE